MPSHAVHRLLRRLGKVQHFCCDGKPLLGVLRPHESEEHSQQAVGDQLRVAQTSGHRHRLRGVHHQLLPLPGDPQVARQAAEGSRLEGTVFRPESLQRFLEQANRFRCGKTDVIRHMYELQRSTDQALGRP